MTAAEIESKILSFVDQGILEGVGEDLTPSTPLFELGILDSFTVFGLLGFIGREFNLTLSFDTLTSDHLKDVASIAELVRTRLGEAWPAGTTSDTGRG